MNVLVVDIGGTHVKVCASGADEPRRFESGPDLTPDRLVARVLDLARDWKFDVISLGYPGRVDGQGARAEPGNLGDGWVGFDFSAAFDRPVRIANDAVMQALGAYDGGRMLFLGLGTGLGSAFAAEHVIVPLELGNLPSGRDGTLGDRVGRKGLEAYGADDWVTTVRTMVPTLQSAFAADYVVLGGGNSNLVEPLPANTRRGGNADAIVGGIRLWEEVVEPHDRKPALVWRVVA